MQLKQLVEGAHRVVAVVDGDRCPAEEFLTTGEASTSKVRVGLIDLLKRCAANGLQGMPSQLVHLVDAENQIYEFIKGPLRLFFFKGKNGEIAICSTGGRKKGRKVDPRAVAAAIRHKKRYEAALEAQSVTYI